MLQETTRYYNDDDSCNKDLDHFLHQIIDRVNMEANTEDPLILNAYTELQPYFMELISIYQGKYDMQDTSVIRKSVQEEVKKMKCRFLPTNNEIYTNEDV